MLNKTYSNSWRFWYLYRGKKNYKISAALVVWHIAWPRYITLKTVCLACKRIQQSTIFIHGKENMFLPIISSCSNLAGCQCERKLCRYALKMWEGIWMQRHVLLRGGWDLNEPWLVCDLTWVWNVSRFDRFVNGMSCVSHLLMIPSKWFILLENGKLDFPPSYIFAGSNLHKLTANRTIPAFANQKSLLCSITDCKTWNL